MDDEPEPSNHRALLAAVAMLGLLVVVSLWLTGVLGSSSAIQDCVASGRTNCAPVTTPSQ